MKRVLVISHQPFDRNTNNGRTLLEFFDSYGKENIAQLFLHPDSVNEDFCNKYFLINEVDIIKSFFCLKLPGKVIMPSIIEENNKDEDIKKIYLHGSKKKSFYVLVRNLIWDINTWFNKKLKKWLSDFNPECIFFFVGNCTFSLKLVDKISKYLKIPVVMYVCDDSYINHDLKRGFFGLFNDYIYRKNFRKAIKNYTYICISDLMLKDYQEEFKKEGHCIRTASSLMPFDEKFLDNKIKMTYLGNISFNRYKSLIDIADIIEENNLPIDFSVYSAENREWILNQIKKSKNIDFKGMVSYSEVLGIMENSDIIVHVEAFDSDSIKSVKYSCSTKIADILNSNRCMLAYGPKEVASIDYLLKNDCALVATSKDDLKNTLLQICSDRNIIKDYTKKGLIVGNHNHQKEINCKSLNDIIELT